MPQVQTTQAQVAAQQTQPLNNVPKANGRQASNANFPKTNLVDVNQAKVWKPSTTTDEEATIKEKLRLTLKFMAKIFRFLGF